MQRPAPVIATNLSVGNPSLREGEVLRDIEITLQRRIEVGNPLEYRLGEPDG